jgi:hypothetical protein
MKGDREVEEDERRPKETHGSLTHGTCSSPDGFQGILDLEQLRSARNRCSGWEGLRTCPSGEKTVRAAHQL